MFRKMTWLFSFVIYFLHNQNITHALYIPVAVIAAVARHISASVGVIRLACSTKPYSRVGGIAVVLFVSKDTNSCLGIKLCATNYVKAFLVTVGLQGSFRSN